MNITEKRDEISKVILSGGGEVAHVVGNEEELEILTKKGQFFSGENSIVVGGKPMLCFGNSLEFYLNNEGMRICTGYAINFSDGVWVKHAWCIDQEGVVHECTPVKRDKYWGAILDELETERYRRENDPEYDVECRMKEVREQGFLEKLRESVKEIGPETMEEMETVTLTEKQKIKEPPTDDPR